MCIQLYTYIILTYPALSSPYYTIILFATGACEIKLLRRGGRVGRPVLSMRPAGNKQHSACAPTVLHFVKSSDENTLGVTCHNFVRIPS